MIRQLRSIFASIVFLGMSSFAFAQNAQIQGQVTDTTGALISKATVRAVNQQTGTERKVETNHNGFYTVTFLEPSLYKIFVQAKGFSTAVSTPVTLNVAQNAVLNFKLEVGADSETVTVDGDETLINTTDASISTVVDRKFVENIPLNGRSFQDLISMTQGVVTQSPQATSYGVQAQGDFSVNGQRTESNSYLVDGVSANVGAGYPNGRAQSGTAGAVSASTALGTTQSLLSVDALQEFRVSSSTYSAEYGRTPGGEFSFLSRSGTNAVHGSVYDYFRNDLFDSNDWFNDHNHIAKTAVRQNDFGGTLGGPIILPHLYRGNNRSFFFVSYEGLRLVQPTAAITQYVPSLAVRASAAPALQAIWNAFPIPTGPELTTSTGNLSGLSPFVSAYSLPATINSTSVRVDHALSNKFHIFFRYATVPTQSISRILSSRSAIRSNTDTATFGADVAFSNVLSNELRVGYASGESIQDSRIDSYGGASPIDLGAAMGISGYSSYQYLPYISIAGIGLSNLNQFYESNKLSQWNVTDSFTWSRNRHLIKFGIDERHLRSPLNPTSILGEPVYYSRATMLSNVSTVYLGKYVPSTPIFNEFSAFLQDEWKIAPAFSVSAGTRWEVNPPPTEAHGQSAYTLLGDVGNPTSLQLAPRGTPLWKTTWWNFAPRLGIAWKVHNDAAWETVIRSGGGAYFDTGNQVAAAGYSGLGFGKTSTLVNTALPVSSSQLNFSTDAVPPYTGSTVYAFPSHLQLPYTLQWNVSLEQALGNKQSLTMSYVGANGRRLIQSRSSNFSSLNPLFGTVYYYPASSTSNYNALQVRYQRSLSAGLQVLASYGWSHSLDYGSTNATLPLTYGNSDFDVRHNFQTGISWNLPQVHGNSLTKTVFSDWSIDERTIVRTAFPITLTGNLKHDAQGNDYYTGVNYDSSRAIYLYGSQYPGGRVLNGGANNTSTPAFSLPVGSASGNAPRNFVRGFGEAQVNLALRKEFRLYESLRLQFRAESFNVLNHPTFGYVNPTLSNAQFGQATKMLSQSLNSVSSLYQQGGPRSMQFALRLAF